MHHTRNMQESNININMSTEEKAILIGVVLDSIDHQQYRIRQYKRDIKELLEKIEEAQKEIQRLNLWLEKINKEV